MSTPGRISIDIIGPLPSAACMFEIHASGCARARATLTKNRRLGAESLPSAASDVAHAIRLAWGSEDSASHTAATSICPCARKAGLR